MITISINEQPLLDAKHFLADVGADLINRSNDLKERAGSVVSHIKNMIDVNPAKAAYFATTAANLASYKYGFGSFTNLGLMVVGHIALNCHAKAGQQGKVSEEDKKLAVTARVNNAINIGSSIFGFETLKVALTVYNCLSDYIKVSVKG